LAALPQFTLEANALATEINADSTIASNAASTATAASLAALALTSVTLWVSGTTYAVGVAVYSPLTFYTYRRKVSGAGTTDPSVDTTNWAQVTGTGNVSTDVSGNLGVGTGTPLRLFHIRSTQPTFMLEESDAPANEKYWLQYVQTGDFKIEAINDALTTSSLAYVITRNAGVVGEHQFYTDGSERFKILSTGEVVVNGGSADYALNVNGSIGISANINISGLDQLIKLLTVDGADNGRLNISSSSAVSTGRGAYIQISGNEHTNPGRMVLASGSVGGVRLVGGTDGVYLNGGSKVNGNLNISGQEAFAPANTRLHVDRLTNSTVPSLSAGTVASFVGAESAANDAFLQIVSGNTGNAGLRFGDTDAANRGNINYAQTSDLLSIDSPVSLELRTAGVARLAINSTGVVSYAGNEIGYRNVPLTSTSGLTATTAVRGAGYLTSGGITVPASVFAKDDVFTIVNNTAAAITITQGSGLTLRLAGTTNTGNFSLGAYGIATVVFVSATVAHLSGSGVA
jgi:hypothetical protein